MFPQSINHLIMKYLAIVFAFILFSLNGFAQEEEYSRKSSNPYGENKPEKRWNFGGGGGLSFGTVTYIMASPQVTYSLTNKILFGSSFTYIYNRTNWDKIYPTYGWGIVESNIYGGSLFNEILVYKNFFSHIEYEVVNHYIFDSDISDIRKDWTPGFLIGGGIRQYIGEHSFAQITLLYDLLYDSNRSYYSSQLVPRVSFFF